MQLISVWLGPSCDLLPVTAVPDSTALHILCLTKPLLFMNIGQKVYNRMEGKFLSAPGLLKGKFVKQLLKLMANFFSFLWNLRLKI